MDACDVLVVGGGPAGSALAGTLTRAGLDVVILDKAVFPRDKVCAGWITPAVLHLLTIDRHEYARGRVLQEFRGFRTGLIGRPGILTRYDGVVSHGIRRSEFDHYLLMRSKARLRLGEPLQSMERAKGAWIINGSITAPLVVGAGGHFCPIARSLRPDREGDGPIVVAQETEFLMDRSQQDACPVQADTPELYFCPDLKGYGWCVRKGDFLNIGLGSEEGRDLPGQVREFLASLHAAHRIPRTTPEHFKGHAYRLSCGVHRHVVDDNVLLIGDAAGLAHPRSGEGIRPAIESALLAADVVLAADRDYSRGTLARYPRELAERFGADRPSPAVLPPSFRRVLGRRLMASRWFSRRVLLDRWFLNRCTPC